MPVVLQALASDCNTFNECTAITTTEQSVVTFTGTGSASVTPIGSNTPIIKLSASNPLGQIPYAGDFNVCLSVPCDKTGTLSVDTVASVPVTGLTGTPAGSTGASFNTFHLPSVCASVDLLGDGVVNTMFVYPVVSVVPETGQRVSTVYYNLSGEPVTGTVTVGNPCDCDCLQCDESATSTT